MLPESGRTRPKILRISGFARAIGTEQAEAGALAHVQRDTRDGGQFTVALDDGVQAQGRCGP